MSADPTQEALPLVERLKTLRYFSDRIRAHRTPQDEDTINYYRQNAEEAASRIEALEAENARLREALARENEECAKVADREKADAELILTRAKRRAHKAGLLLAVGYQGDPDAEVIEAEAIAATAVDIANGIRARSALEANNG